MFSEKKRKITFGPSATVKTGLLVLLASIGFMLTVTVTATAHAAAGSAVELPVPEDVRAVVIDGKTAFYASEPEIRAVLDGIIDDYTDDSTVSACFRESVELDSEHIPSGSEVLGSGEIARLLDPKGDSAWSLTVLTRRVESRTVTIPGATETVENSEKYQDEVRVLQEGHDGEAVCEYVLVCANGVETMETQIGETVTVEMVPEIIEEGSLPGSRTDSKGYYIWPTVGTISSKFGSRTVKIGSSNHQGVDIANAKGTEVNAADGGTVIYAQNSKNGYGNLIKIQHDNGAVTYYAHLSEILVSVGDKVAQGDLIALMGATGNVSGPHLHFEIRPNGITPVNPIPKMTGELQRS